MRAKIMIFACTLGLGLLVSDAGTGQAQRPATQQARPQTPRSDTPPGPRPVTTSPGLNAPEFRFVEPASGRFTPLANAGFAAIDPAEGAAASSPASPDEPQQGGDRIRLKSRDFVPQPGLESGLPAVAAGPRHGLIQFRRIPGRAERTALHRAGVELFTYIPDRAFLARLPANIRPVLRLSIVRFVGVLQPTDKVEPRILKEGVNLFARSGDGYLRLSVLFFEDVSPRQADAVVSALGGRITEAIHGFHLFRVELPEESLLRLLAEDTVQWVEDIFENQILNDGARTAMGVDLVHAPPYGLDGTGSVVGEWDGGHAITTGNALLHQDHTGRVTRGDTTTDSFDAHATHVAGTVIGSGLLSALNGGTALLWKGMAPQATLIAYDWTSFLAEYSGAIGTHHIDLSTNSWHNGGNGSYTSDSSALDKLVTGSQGGALPILWAAGNQRGGLNHKCDVDLDANTFTRYDAYDCIVNLASAKNTLSIGATNSNDDSMTDFSSWGPTNDGRLKPEIVAPGCEVGGNGIRSTFPTDVYGNLCGTSMATPATAGSVAVLLQRYRQVCPASGGPLPSTVKALLVHTARDLDDASAWYNRGPDFASGYGRLDLPRTVDLVPFHFEDAVAHGGVQNYSIVVAPQQDLKVTLAWDDDAAAPNASVALINDLDLDLVDPMGTVHQPWVLNPLSPAAPATRGIDGRNVVEQVVIDTVSASLAGTWTVRVKGTNVPSLSQGFSLVSELLPATSCAGPTPAADLWGADTPLDSGIEPNPDPGPMWISDDIRVRHAPGDGPHQNPEFGQTNYAFVTVRNRGGQVGPYALVFLYWANGSTALSWPTDWNLLGTAAVVNVPSGGSSVVGPIPWNPAGAGHYCLYARMVTFHEPIAPEGANVYSNTQARNQIIWKNVTVVDLLAGQPYEATFLLRNTGRARATFKLVFQEPREQLRDPFLNHGEIVVDLGKPLFERWRRFGAKLRGLRPIAETRFQIVDPRRAELLGLTLNPRETFTVRIRFSATELSSGARYRFDVTQEPATESRPVGGVSYFLRAGGPGRV